MKLDMPPRAPGYNITHRGVVQSVLVAYRAISGSACNFCADFKHLRLRDPRGSNSFASRFEVQTAGKRVVIVDLLRNPFEIFRPIIGLVAVLVVYLRPSFRVRDERCRHKPMNASGHTFSANGKCDLFVAGAVETLSQREPAELPDCDDFPSVGNCVAAFKAGYLFPSIFHKKIIPFAGAECKA